MGNAPCKNDQILVSYNYQFRKNPITFKIYDDFPYPKKLKNIEIEDQFKEILSKCNLTNEQIDQLKAITFEVKWKLICKHRFMILTGLCDYRQTRKSISQFYAESIKNSNAMVDLDCFFVWVSKDAKEIDINSFLNYGGIDILLDLLQRAEVCSRSTKNHGKQILILKILNYLCRFPQVVDKLITTPESATKIFLNFNRYNWEISKYVLQLLNDYYTWKNEKGQLDVIKALNSYKTEFNLKFRFEPFMEILSSSKNVIMLESILAFINALIESPEQDEKRALLRSEFSSYGIKTLIEVIKDKIHNDEYKLEDCTYKAYLEECQDYEFTELKNQENQDGHDASRTTLYFSDNEEELFLKKLNNVLKQIEIFENGFLEFLDEMESSSVNSDSFSSFQNEIGQELNSADKLKEIRSLHSIKSLQKNKEIDFSDVNELFNRTRTKSLENDNYEDFLTIMQNFCLIPSNEDGNKIWKKIREALNEINGLGKNEKIMDVGKLKKLIENKENLEDLQKKIIFLNTQLSIRDDEIKLMQNKIKEAEFTKQTYKISNEQIINNLLKEKENNKALNHKLVENELRNAKLIKDRDEKLHRYDEKIKKLSKNLSYSPTSKSLSTNSSTISTKKTQIDDMLTSMELENKNLKQEIENLKKNSNNNKPNGSIKKNENFNKNENLTKEPLMSIPEKDETPINSEKSLNSQQSSKLISVNTISVGIQTDFCFPEKKEEELKSNLMMIPRKSSFAITFEQKKSIEDRSPINHRIYLAPPPPPLLLGIGGLPFIPNFASLHSPKSEKPIKEKKAPTVPMKQICWTNVNPNNITNTVWESMNENEVIFEIEEIEKLFTSKRPEKKKEIPKLLSLNTKITLLSCTKSKNISIALSKLKLSLSAISEAVMKIDKNVLNLNVVGSLLEACPKEEEINIVSSYEGDKSMLDLPERFVLEIKTVPGFRIRLEALQFYLTYRELVEDFSLKIDKLTGLLENILENEKFYLLLKYTLALGNYFNGSGARGGAFGFKLDAFDKIVDMKTVDGKKSFLAYMIELIEKNTGKCFIDVNEDLTIYDIGRKLPISQLLIDLADIKKGCGLVNEAIQSKSDNPFDNVEYFFLDFTKTLFMNIKEFDQLMQDLQDLYKKICGFYCEDPLETPSDCFVEKVYKIWTACKKAKTIITKEKELLKKEEIRLKKNEERANKAQFNNSNKLECPEELANYIQNRRMIRHKPDLEKRKYGSILKQRMSIKFNENILLEMLKKENK